jgi:hypothetical protein
MRVLPIILFLSSIISNPVYPGGKGKSYAEIIRSDNDTTMLKNVRTDSFRLRIEMPSSGVRFYKDQIVFLSQTKNEAKMLPLQLSFGTVQAYFAPVEDTATGKHLLFSSAASFSFPTEAITFNRDYDTMYFTKLNSKTGKECIYRAEYSTKDKNQPGWIFSKTPVEFCIENSSYSHPSLSSNGKLMVFASNKRGTLGKMDLFFSRFEDGKWSSPENAGNTINSTDNEFFPFLDENNNLYFSSDGLKGAVGFDVYSCRFNGQKWENPVLLPGNINSKDNDIAFTIARDGKSAFFSRRSKSDPGFVQLFRVTLNDEPSLNKALTISDVFVAKPEPVPVAVQPKPAEKVTAAKTTASKAKKTTPSRQPAQKSVKVSKPDSVKPSTAVPAPGKESTASGDTIVYRIQITSSEKPKGSYRVPVNGKQYPVFEYFHQNAYRQTIGEFSTYKQALEFQNVCRQSNLPNAFVVVFKNNKRLVQQSPAK